MHAEEFLPTLTSLGLEEKQAKVYIASLEGAGTVAELALRAELKRPTVYLIVDELKSRGLLSTSIQGRKTVYTAAAPTVLRQLAEQRLRAVEQALPSLESLTATQPGRPKVQVYEGRSGMELVYREMLRQREVIFWADIAGVYDQFGEIYEQFLKRVRAGEIAGRELWSDTPSNRRYARRLKREKLGAYEIRIGKNRRFFGDAFSYGQVVVFISLKAHNLFVIRIENEDIVNSLRSLFDLAWQSAKRI